MKNNKKIIQILVLLGFVASVCVMVNLTTQETENIVTLQAEEAEKKENVVEMVDEVRVDADEFAGIETAVKANHIYSCLDEEYKIIEKYICEQELTEWGKVDFVPAYFEAGFTNQWAYYLIRDNKIVYEFPRQADSWGLVEEIKGTGFTDLNGDGIEDVFVIYTYCIGAGPQGAIPRHNIHLYLSQGKEYFLAEELNEKIYFEFEEEEYIYQNICEYVIQILKENDTSVAEETDLMKDINVFLDNSVDQFFEEELSDWSLPECAIRDLQTRYFETWEEEYQSVMVLIRAKCVTQEDVDACNLFDEKVQASCEEVKQLFLNEQLKDCESEKIDEAMLNGSAAWGNGTAAAIELRKGNVYRNACMTLKPYLESEYEYPTVEEIQNRVELITDEETVIVKTIEEAMEQSVVHISMKDSVGSGVIVKIKENEMIIVSNKHLLQKDVEANVTLANGKTYQAEVLGLSQQYDIGFLTLQVPNINLREVEQVEPPYSKESLYLGMDVLQYSSRNAGVIECYEGYILGEIHYRDEFHSDILPTKCYSAAGMSGGAVFHSNSEFLGIIAGGEVSDEATTRESQVTYCIPADLIWEAYTEVTGEGV